MIDGFDQALNPKDVAGHGRTLARQQDQSKQSIPELVSELYKDAPAPLRTRLLECLLGPVGPLAIVAIATGAFAHLLYRLRLDGVPVSMDDVARVSSEHVLELARYVEQCDPQALLRVGSLIAGSPIGIASVSGSALLLALSAWRHRQPKKSEIG